MWLLPYCLGAVARLQRHPCGIAIDAQDRHSLREAMLAQSGGPLPAGSVVGSPVGDGASDN